MVSVFLLTLTIYQTSAQTELVKQMVQDSDVQSFVSNTEKLLFINSSGVNISNIGEEYLVKYNNLPKQITDSKAIVKAKFPAFASMTESEQAVVIAGIAKEMRTQGFGACIGQVLAKYLVCAGISAGTWAAVKWYMCVGVTGAAAPEALPLEVQACTALVVGSLGGLAFCTEQLIQQVLAC